MRRLKSRANIIGTASPYLPNARPGASLGQVEPPVPFFWPGVEISDDPHGVRVIKKPHLGPHSEAFHLPLGSPYSDFQIPTPPS
jgi:hypothetical protein